MPEKVRRIVAARAQGRCEYCQSPLHFSTDPFSIEHIIPRVRGGRGRLGNLALACQGCNGAKYTQTEALDTQTGELAPLFHPRRHKWQKHFAWSADYTQIIGLTASGRATVNKLQLNRAYVVNLRRALIAYGEHPPLGTD